MDETEPCPDETISIADMGAVPETPSERVAGHDIVYIFRAYTNKEISFDEWLRRSREWAERVKAKYRKEN